jgi:Protein of unknown function (DUF3035)
MTTRFAAAGCTIVLALALTGCSDATKKDFGLEANPPDAFQVGTQAPLALPPELSQLPVPNPGEPRPQQVNAAQAGADVLDPENVLTGDPANLSSGGQELLQEAGPTPPANIRAEVNQNALIASKPPGFVSELIGNGPTPPPTVNASAEERRLQENEALGHPMTQGATPQNGNANQGFLDRLASFF